MSEILEVIKWYEEQFGRKLTELEKASIRNQVSLNKFDTPEIKDLEQLGIRLGGLEYGKQ